MEIEFVPDVLVDADVIGSATLSVGAISGSLDYTVLEIDRPILPSIQVAICA